MVELRFLEKEGRYSIGGFSPAIRFNLLLALPLLTPQQKGFSLLSGLLNIKLCNNSKTPRPLGTSRCIGRNVDANFLRFIGEWSKTGVFSK